MEPAQLIVKSPLPAKANRPQRRARGRPGDLGGKSVGAETIVLRVCELLRELAPRDITLLRVAEYAGVDRSLIRYYFKNRSSLLLAAARYLFAQLIDELAPLRELPPEEWETQIREYTRALLRYQIKHPYFHRLMIDEVVNSAEPEAHAFFESVTSAGIARHRARARAAARQPGIRTVDGAFLYLAVIGMCEFFVTAAPILKVAFGKAYDAEVVSRQYEDFICRYVIDGLREA